MGQCSTLPAEGRNDSPSGPNHQVTSPKVQQRDDVPTSYRRYPSEGNIMIDEPENSGNHPGARHNKSQRYANGYHLQVNTISQNDPGHPTSPYNHMESHTIQPHSGHSGFPLHPQHPHPSQQRYAPMPSTNRSSQETIRLPPPPEASVRTRCYKLNLDSDLIGLSPEDMRLEGKFLGPFADAVPPLTYSTSEDSATANVSSTTIAIQTAQIFRGITVGNDGTILSQNARATRSSRGNKTKRGEKSRQAAKIDKAKDLVDEEVANGRTPGSKDPANMVSLVSVGEYDEMKFLVKDGAKKLRDAKGLPDDALLAIGRQRGGNNPYQSPILSPSRKRVSPYQQGSSGSQFHHSSPKNPKPSNPLSPTNSMKSRSHSIQPQQQPQPHHHFPPSPRRLADERQQPSRRNLNLSKDRCFQETGGPDWTSMNLSRGFNSIWNCGASGTISPTQMTNEPKQGYPHHHRHHHPMSPSHGHHSYHHHHQAMAVDGRSDTNYRVDPHTGRIGSGRIDPAGYEVRI